MAIRDPYETLGVSRDADADEIKSAYRRLARRYHPDVNPDDPSAEDKFKEVGEAYSILSDPERKARFDRFGVADEVPGAPGPDFFTGAGGFGDLFEMFFGGRGGSGRHGMNGEDLQTAVKLSLRDVLEEQHRKVTYQRMASCDACKGTGAEGGAQPDPCTTCGGTGSVTRIQNTFLGSVRTSMPCGTCGGTGGIIRNPCSRCKGSQRVQETREVDIRIPPGVESGVAIHVPGAGGDPVGFGRPGDLYVRVDVSVPKGMERDGTDLHLELPLSFVQATIGDTVDVEGVEGPLTVDVPAGTQPGEALRVRGAGVPPLHGGRRGDLYGHVVVHVPKNLTDQQKDLLLQFNEALGGVEPQGKGSLIGGLFKKRK